MTIFLPFFANYMKIFQKLSFRQGAIHKLCRLGRGEDGVGPKDDLLNRPYLINKTTLYDNVMTIRR